MQVEVENLVTAEQLLQRPDAELYEISGGCLVVRNSRGSKHDEVITRLAVLLAPFAD